MRWQDQLLGLGITLVDHIPASDAMKLKVAKLAMLHRPNARRHLNHFLDGQGQPLKVDTASVLHEDSGVRRELQRQIAIARQFGQSAGQVHIPQRCFTSEDWRLALGGCGFAWRIENGEPKVWINDRYAWSPEQARISQPLHEAAQRLNDAPGPASAFDMSGTQARLDVDEDDACLKPCYRKAALL